MPQSYENFMDQKGKDFVDKRAQLLQRANDPPKLHYDELNPARVIRKDK